MRRGVLTFGDGDDDNSDGDDKNLDEVLSFVLRRSAKFDRVSPATIRGDKETDRLGLVARATKYRIIKAEKRVKPAAEPSLAMSSAR